MFAENVSFKEQVEKFSSRISINPAYLSYISDGELSDDITEQEYGKINKFMEKWEYADGGETIPDSPIPGRCAVCGEDCPVIEAVFINKEAVRDENQRRETQRKQETEQRISGLSAENRETFEKIFAAHIVKQEFIDHPEIKELFRAKLADVFFEANRQGLNLKTAERTVEPAQTKTEEKHSLER